MSNAVIGKVEKIKTPTVVGSKPTLLMVPVAIPSYRNRKTCASTIKKYLKKGFDYKLWSPPQVAKLPSGEMYLYDGDHRRAMFKIAHPNDVLMEAQVVDVSSLEEVSRLFVAINKTNRKTLAAEETFVHEVLAKQQDDLDTEKHLNDCKLSVALGTGEPNDFVGSTIGYVNQTPVSVKIKGFKDAIREVNKTSVQKASELIQTTWSTENSVSVELLYGFARIFKDIPQLSDVKTYPKFNTVWSNWLAFQKSGNAKSAAFHKTMKKIGGSEHHKEGLCVALGILEEFKDWSISNVHLSDSVFSNYNIPSVIVSIKEDIKYSK